MEEVKNCLRIPVYISPKYPLMVGMDLVEGGMTFMGKHSTYHTVLGMGQMRRRMVGEGGGMESPSAALASRITQWPVGGRRSQPRVFLSASCCAATAGRRDYAFYRHVMNSLKTPVSLE